MTKMTFGEFVGSVIAGHSGATVAKVGNDFFNMDSLVDAAKGIDTVILTAQLEDRKLSAFESVMVEILLSLGGWKDVARAQESYKRYLNKNLVEFG
jgi:uncharacterized protein YbjT (DUF2867 family)